jgi:hypothetical protein
LVSPDDANLATSVVSTWPDGSARVMVLAGQATIASGSTKQIKLNVGIPTGISALTTSNLIAIVQQVAVNFGVPLDLTLTTSNHDRVWWANSQVICARYRLPITNKGVMEAVIDVHAFAGGRAFVEFVIENGKLNSTASTLPDGTVAAQTYTGATVSINGTSVATLGTPISHTWGGATTYASQTHEAFRAVYVGAWVNGGTVTPINGSADPRIEVTHDSASLQALFAFTGKPPRAKTYNAETSTSVAEYGYGKNGIGQVTQPYRDDLYAPWDYGRNKGASMGSPGGIRQLPKGDWQYIQGPDKWTRRAVIASTLGLHSFPVNYRDSTTGNVPTWTQIGTKARTGGANVWPEVTSYPDFEGGHQPGYGLVAFLCQPSPCFIELMQKICCWNGSWAAPVSAPDYAQTRQRAWLVRNCVHALYITPDGHPYKSSIEQSLAGYVSYLDQFRTSGRYEAGVFMGVTLTSQEDARSQNASTFVDGFQAAHWQQSWLLLELVRAHRTKIHSNPTTRALIKTVAEWQLDWVIRWVNEQSATGAWRYICQYHTVGRVGAPVGVQFYSTDPDCFANWDEGAQWAFLDYPAPATTTWMGHPDAGASVPSETKPRYANYTAFGQANFYDYAAYVWPAICAAAESGLPGSDLMWDTVRAGISNLGTYLNSTATDPDHKCAWPRNKTLDV